MKVFYFLAWLCFSRPRPVHRREEGGAAGDAAGDFAAPLFVVDGCPAGAPARRPEEVERGVSEVPAVEVALVPQERRRERVRLVGHAPRSPLVPELGLERLGVARVAHRRETRAQVGDERARHEEEHLCGNQTFG